MFNAAVTAINVNDNKRVININNPQETKFCSNRISTSKYNVLSFLPKFIFEQGRKYSNIFFFLIVLLQQVPDVSPTGRFTTMVPWILILTVSAVKEIIEDIKRTFSDRQINNKKINSNCFVMSACGLMWLINISVFYLFLQVFQIDQFASARWKDIKVGDVVKITAGELFPADLLLLSSSEPNSICYIQTSNLDGETNLKIRQGLTCAQSIINTELLHDFYARIECEQPNQELYKFSGNLILSNGDVHPFDANQILLRGSQLRNSKWIYGVVIYTGHDTKLMRNSNAPPFKRSHVEKTTNTQILLLFLILLIICLISTIASSIWLRMNASNHWYLGFNELPYNSIGYIFLTFIILYNNLIPISLQVTLEVVKFLQAYFINNDAEMYDEENDFPAMARTSNLNEELGQISYVFTDKTGTLTRNQMEFKLCSIAGICYGSGNQSAFDPYEIIKNLQHHETKAYIDEFLNVLSTCHTVIPEKTATGYVYQASSPDEGAIVQCLEKFGVVFDSRTPSKLHVTFLGEERTFEVLNVLEFNSVRKRVSVIIRDHTGTLKLYCKGADNVIIPRLRVQQDFKDQTIEHLECFAREGFRTLLVASKQIDESEYAQWSRAYFEAATSLVEREKKIQDVAEFIEKDMHLLGATAIEDKLQEGVPETISMLKSASIKVWVLTGDKIETAVNIGYSCKLLNEATCLIYLTSDNIFDLRNTLLRHCNDFDDPNRQQVSIGIITDATALNLVLKDECSENFLKLAKNADTVVCCRATPKNKADVVDFIKQKTDSITLSIGDGANDVAMIQAAHVGVGIYGKEGLQALSASDYAIGQFRFLKNLLFVHGIWNYKRLCKVILYSFYKNICLYVIELWFAFSNGFSGQIIFERWLIGLYNVLFTAAPPLALGLFDRPLTAATMLKNPKLYKITQSKSDFNIKIFWAWMLNSVIHSILLYYSCFGALKHEVAFSDGTVGDFLFLGNHVYTYCVVVVCLKAGLETDSWTWITCSSIFGSILFWFVFLIIYSNVWPSILIGAEMSGMAVNLLRGGIFWFGLLFVPVFVLLPDITYKALQRTIFKTLDQEVQEKEIAHIDPSPLLETKFYETARLIKNRLAKSFTRSKSAVVEVPPSTYRGYAFSQEENGVVSQADLVRQYDSNVNKPLGN